ncbi:tail fiber assembly protein [Rahnella aquatilis]|nr:tail fiber assembly protein [Rahnella aquatilis]
MVVNAGLLNTEKENVRLEDRGEFSVQVSRIDVNTPDIAWPKSPAESKSE